VLRVAGLQASYGRGQVLFDIRLDVGQGELVTLLGRNGMGKTTTIRAIMGLVARQSGTIEFDAKVIGGLTPEAIARRGVGLVPEGRQIFSTLTVEENLIATAANRLGRDNAWTLTEIYALFPRLRERRRQLGSTLSGGEQQMLAIARALVSDPKLLLLDEPSQGLAPLVVRELARVIRLLVGQGVTILLVEQNMKLAEAVADELHVMVKGRLVYGASPEKFRTEEAEIRSRYLTV
jgi:branched-chain amino acid transport system ATP-binding protein